MTTTTLRLDEPLKRRLSSLAQSAGRTPHSLMVEALEQKADELEAQNAFARLAAKRGDALQAGEKGVEWHDMKVWLRSRVKSGATSPKTASGKRETKVRAKVQPKSTVKARAK